MRLIRPLTAEFLGTYALVFAGTAAAVSDNFPSAKFGILGIALAHGLILGAWITAGVRLYSSPAKRRSGRSRGRTSTPR